MTNDLESQIASYLFHESIRQEPRNHTVPIYEIFPDSDDPSISYMVMPFLSLADHPPPETIGEVVDFCDQILEVGSRAPWILVFTDQDDQTTKGLVFMHEQGVAHR